MQVAAGGIRLLNLETSIRNRIAPRIDHAAQDIDRSSLGNSRPAENASQVRIGIREMVHRIKGPKFLR